MFAVSKENFTAAGTADILLDEYIPLWGCPVTLLSDNGQQFTSKLTTIVYDRVGIRKVNTSAYHPCTNGGVERVNHVLAQMLSMVGNEKQTDWDVLLPHVSAAYINSVNVATRLAPNEIHIGRLPRLPLSVFEPENIGGHQRLGRDHLVHINIATDRQQRAHSPVRELHRLTVSRLQRRNAPIMTALLASPPFSVGGWAWVYNSASTICQGVKKGTDATVLKTKLSLNWNGPFKILAVGPTAASDTPDDRPLQAKLFFLDLPSDLPGRDSKSRVSVKRCKPCHNPDDTSDIPKHLPEDLTTYVLTASAAKPPPTTSPLTTSHHHRSVSRLSRSPAINSYAAAVGSSPSYTRPTEPDSSAPRGNASSTFNNSGAMSYSTGPGSRHNTVRPIASTARCASAPHTTSSPDLKANSFSAPATPWSPATFGFAVLATPPSPPGHTSGTRHVTASGG